MGIFRGVEIENRGKEVAQDEMGLHGKAEVRELGPQPIRFNGSQRREGSSSREKDALVVVSVGTERDAMDTRPLKCGSCT